ncbi:MAG: CsbD family protein [Acidimicrobiales bacterium]
MVDNADDLKGRIKEAAGDLTDDDDLKREGQIDQGKGKVKKFVDDVADKFKR